MSLLKAENISTVTAGNYTRQLSLTYIDSYSKTQQKYIGNDITISPFHNCQIYTIASFANIFLTFSNVIDILNAIQQHIGKTELQVDVHSGYQKNVEKLFLPEEIIFKVEYKNNTGSHMTQYLLQIQKMLVRVAKEEKERIVKEKQAEQEAIAKSVVAEISELNPKVAVKTTVRRKVATV